MHPTGAAPAAARVVLVTGEPGSGKTTLGTDLARELRVPFLARDDVRGGLFLTAGAWTDRPPEVPTAADAVEAFLRLVETMAGLGVSCVAEYVVRRARPHDLARFTAVADCVVVGTWCRDPLARFARRAGAERLVNRPPVLEALGCASVDEHTGAAVERMRAVAREMRTEFDLPMLRVNTDDGYDPGLDHIVDFVTRR
ncbi:MAG TPA: AAA family ATPase [Acidimicrobiales bacterium]|jgi:predicted kinase|nr:AAA family ATPase [Acidimicrobiales bacterium]